MENQDQNPTGTGNTQNPGGTAGAGGDPDKTPPEGFVPKEQFTASQTEAIKLKKELDTLKQNPPQGGNLPEDKKKVFEAIDEYGRIKEAESKKEQEEIKSNLDKLRVIHGDFDEQKLKDIVKDYGVFSDDGNINWEKGMELYKKFGNSVVKKPQASGARTSDHPVEAEKVEVRSKGFHNIIEDFKGKLGF